MAERYFYKEPDAGWVFYNDENGSIYDFGIGIGYWEMIRLQGKKDIEEIYQDVLTTFSPEVNRAQFREYGEAIKGMATQERARENKLMEELTGKSFQAIGPQFLKDFNEIILGAPQFRAILDRVNIAIDRGAKNKDKKYRAPSMAVNFTSYFISALHQTIKNYTPDQLADDAIWDTIIYETITNAIDGMLLKNSQRTLNKMFGMPEEYSHLEAYLKNNPAFYEFIRTYLPIDALHAEITQLTQARNTTNISRAKVSELYKLQIKSTGGNSSEAVTRNLAGFIHEFFSSGNMQVFLNADGRTVLSTPVISKKGATDTFTLLSKKLSLNLANIEDQLQLAADGPTQERIAQNFKEINQKFSRKKYEELFIIHGSDKLYSMGSKFAGFTKTQKITDIKQLLNQSNIGGGRIGQELIAVYLNTVPGAALDEKFEEVKNVLRILVAAIAGQLLFDDWYMIGQSYTGSTQLHIFDLDGVLIPLSYVLEGLSASMIELSNEGTQFDGSFIQVDSFTRPGNILYPASAGVHRYPGLNTTNGVKDFNTYWNLQRENARAKSQFRIRFMKNFKQVIQKIVALYPKT